MKVLALIIEVEVEDSITENDAHIQHLLCLMEDDANRSPAVESIYDQRVEEVG